MVHSGVNEGKQALDHTSFGAYTSLLAKYQEGEERERRARGREKKKKEEEVGDTLFTVIHGEEEQQN